MARVWWIVGALTVGVSGIVLADGGGPDSAGWSFLDSTEADGPPSAWVVMDGAAPVDPGLVSLPFAFAMGGVDWTTALIDGNGGLLFSGAGMGCPGSADWVGVRTGGRADSPRMRTLGRYPRRGHAVDWGTTQVVLMESLSEAVVHVESVEDDAVVGVMASADAGLAWSCDGSARLGGRSAWFSLSEARTAAHLRSTRRLTEAWWGSRAAEFFGEAVASGDTNDDGLDDVLVGQPEVSTAHLFLGSRTATRTESDDATLLLVGDDDRLGDAVVLADVDGDGLDDAIVGAPDFDSVGTVAVFFGGEWPDGRALARRGRLACGPATRVGYRCVRRRAARGGCDG